MLSHTLGDFTKFAEAHILPEDAVFSNYAGGLTTPTCNEVVSVLTQPAQKYVCVTQKRRTVNLFYHLASTLCVTKRFTDRTPGDVGRLGAPVHHNQINAQKVPRRPRQPDCWP